MTVDNRQAQAREWFLRVQSGQMSDSQQEALADWLCASDDNLAAYQACEAAWHELGALSGSPEGQALRRSVLEPESPAGTPGGRVGRWLNAFWLRGAVAVASLAVVAVGVLFWRSGAPVPVTLYQTGVAQVAEHRLPDGSSITLAADSRLRVRLTEGARAVELLEGRAYFDVASDPERPFEVDAGTVTVRVVGTQFDINQTRERVSVSVREGVVDVSPAERSASAVTLTAGQRVTRARRAALSAVEPVPAADISAWMEGRLVYRNTPLADVVEEVNRYTRGRLSLASPDVAALELTAAIDVNALEAFPELLAKSLPVRVEEVKEDHFVVFSRMP